MAQRLSVLLVSSYLLAVAMWLLATRQIAAPGLLKLLWRSLRPRYQADLTDFRQETGHCWLADVPAFLVSDKGGVSSLHVFENNEPLGPGHCSHDEIRRLGGGRYSHWGSQLYLSTLDNSDPRTNDRRYRIREE
jgi:hypothetical protein